MIETIDLAGEWRFSFETPKLDDTIALPTTTAMAKKGKINEKEETGFLTERYPYEGKAYFEKNAIIPGKYIGKHTVLYLERTRVARVWIDGELVGQQNSLTTPQEFDITDFVKKGEIIIRIEVANIGYPTKGGHMTSPDTQTNWLGIMGRIALDIYGDVYVENLYTVANASNRKAKLTFTVKNRLSGTTSCELKVVPEIMYLEGLIGKEGKNYDAVPAKLPLRKREINGITERVCVSSGESEIKLELGFDDEKLLWSEYTPCVIRLDVSLISDEGGMSDIFSSYASFREFRACSHADTHDFFINGKPTKLRGTHDGMLFPLTGAAPMDLDSWLTVMGTAWQYGINHYRYHTSCPPEAAFLAADLLGIYMEPELPFWGTIAAEGEEGYNKEEQDYLIEEGIRMMKVYGNHPSFCMMSLGNELWGSRERISDILKMLKESDSRFLFTAGSNNFQFVPEILPEEDFYVGARLGPADENGVNKRLIRGSYAQCDAPLGCIQTNAPSTEYDFDEAVLPSNNDKARKEAEGGSEDKRQIAIQFGTGVKLVDADGTKKNTGIVPCVPVVSHEIGQYCMYPDFKEIESYTSVLRASNMEIFRRRLSEKGMADRAEDFFQNSGRFAVACYREELEMMHRSRYIAGYQLLDIKDYTGQGTALVGILNSQMKSKGLVDAAVWRTYASDEVLLAAFKSYIYTQGESFSATVKFSVFNPLLSLEGKKVCWQLFEEGKQDNPLLCGELPINGYTHGLFTVGELSGVMPCGENVSQCLVLSLCIPETRIRNEYRWWLYPEDDDVTQPDAPCEVLVTSNKADARTALNNGERVLYFAEDVKDYVQGFYCTDFWNYTMFRQISESMGKPVPVGTLGLSIDNTHPALAEFVSDTYSTPQWYNIVSNAKCAVLDGKMSDSYRPIVQMIDNVERNHKLGIVFEAKAGNGGRLLICTAKKSELDKCPEGRQLVKSLLHYAQSERFEPREEMEYK